MRSPTLDLVSVAANTVDARRSGAVAALKIALWDVHSALPQLAQVATKLNSVQSRLFFEPVSFSAPLGTWERESEKGVLYLRAEQVAAKLKDKPAQLGIDRMLCFTTFPLKDEATYNLFYWADESNTIAIYSLAGLLDRLDPPVTSLERLIANACITFVGGLDNHEDGAKDCPFYYNDERDIRWIAGPLRICSLDLEKLKSLGRDVATLERLLAVYP